MQPSAPNWQPTNLNVTPKSNLEPFLIPFIVWKSDREQAEIFEKLAKEGESFWN